jgi:hypothetical protein
MIAIEREARADRPSGRSSAGRAVIATQALRVQQGLVDACL